MKFLSRLFRGKREPTREPTLEERFVRFRAEGAPLADVADKLGIRLADAMDWNEKLADEVARARRRNKGEAQTGSPPASRTVGSSRQTVPNIPPLDTIKEEVGLILAFMPTVEAWREAATRCGELKRAGLVITGGPTKQGRQYLRIEGRMPKQTAVRMLQVIDGLGGDIDVVATK